MRLSRFFPAVTAACAVLTAADAAGQAGIPDALEPWRDWVLHGEEYRRCPVLNGSMPGQPAAHVCAWPGELALEVDGGGAGFDQAWQVHADDWLALPGDAEHWPADVMLDGGPAAVVEHAGRPAVRAGPGLHEISGRLSWTRRPASIPIPRQTALLRLRLDGALVERPDVDRGTLWLGAAPEAAAEEDRLEVAVYRLLADGIPVRAVTEIQLDVAGRAREIALGGALLPGFVGERLMSDLPAQLDADGTLRVQVRPGDWRLRLASHARELPTDVAAPAPGAPWPDEEIWSYAADTRLRVAVLEGAPPIDSLAAGVPRDWAGYPSYRVETGTALTLAERSRSDADEPNRLTLSRQLWLDFAGGGFTALDAVRGTVSSGWRLDMADPYVMTMATRDLDAPPAESNLLITEGGAPGTRGVEIRARDLDLTTTARIETRDAVPVTGYVDAYDEVLTTLHLPPGHRLLAAPGADAVAGAWLDDWRLLDLFLALIVATATWRLLGIGPGLLAAAAMVLMMHEPAAPRWVWLNLLIAIGLLRVAPEGRLRRAAGLYRNLSLAAVVLALIPFTINALTTAVYPQLERARLERGVMAPPPLQRLTAPPAAADAAARAPEAGAELGVTSALEDVVVTARQRETPPPRYLPGALVQTGPGLPDWAWTRATLRWTSPVGPEQRYHLVILSRWMLAAWRVAGVVGACALLWLLVRPSLRLPPGLLRGGTGAAGVLLAVSLALPGPVGAQTLGEFPSQALLEELKSRLTEPAPCRPGCAALTAASARVTGNRLTIELELADAAAVAVPLPGAPGSWRADAVEVDGEAINRLYAADDGYWLPLDEGVHSVRLSGALPAADAVTIPFPLPPRRIAVDAPGWEVSGLADGRLLSGALELVRQQQDEPGEALGATEFPPFVRVTRRIEVGLEWLVSTTVERVAPPDAAFTLQIPLLDGEAVLSPDVDVADGRAAAAFAAGQTAVGWQSRLPTTASLVLAAPDDAPWSEHWIFDIGPLWHADLDGLPRAPSRDERVLLEYLPRAGERLVVDLTRPEPAGGDTIAIDAVDYRTRIGQRLAQSTLDFRYRSTRAQQHVVVLPEGSELDRVAIDGDSVPLRLDGTRLELPVTTGAHEVEIAWRNARGAGVVARLDRVDLGAGTTNLEASLRLPQDRWVLLGFGPPLGSAILYWPALLVFALAALALGRLAWSPLRTHEWLLLGLGLSTFAWPTLLLFTVWAFAMSWRGRRQRPLGDRSFNALQVALGALTLAAMAALLGAIPVGLLGAPDMQIVSPVGDGALSWFVDRSDGLTPGAGAVSVSLWLYRAAMLVWALWLSFALLRWLPWAWRAFGRGGLWRGRIAAG